MKAKVLKKNQEKLIKHNVNDLRQVTYSNSNKEMSTFIRFVKDE